MEHSVVLPAKTASRDRTRGLLVLLAFVWTLLWTLLSLVEIPSYLHDPAIPVWQPLVISLVSASVVLCWLIGWFRSGAYERIAIDAPVRWLTRRLVWLPVLALGCIACIYGLRHGIFALAHAQYWHIPWRSVFVYETVKVALFYILWLGLAFGCRTVSDWREQRAKLEGVQHALTAARLDRLKAQLRPHFLFNTLNTISSLMQSDVARADRLLTRFAGLLRASLAIGERDFVPLGTEFELLELYTAIMSERFDDRVNVRWEIDCSALNAQVPALLLQPLLENAFRHGVEKCIGPQNILIRARSDRSHVSISILSSGELPGDMRAGIGLANCRERLRVLFGDAATLSLANAPRGGVVASLSLPHIEVAH